MTITTSHMMIGQRGATSACDLRNTEVHRIRTESTQPTHSQGRA